jgi:hypothetical protein
MTPDEQTISEILSLEDDKAKIAMIQLYTKQQCIAFAEWVAENTRYHYVDGVRFWKLKDDYGHYTTETLYTKFLNQSK